MSLDTLAKLGEFVGGAVVVVSLLYLALQARQAEQSQRSENFGRAVDRIAELLSRWADSAELTRIIAVGSADLESLEPIDRIRFGWIAYEVFGTYEFIYQQHESNVIPKYVWERYSADLNYWLSLPGIRTWWDTRVGTFTASFTALVAARFVAPPLTAEKVRKLWAVE
jgi:hypothetical protein